MNIQQIIGIDEVGRGPLAGPVTIGAFAVLQKNKKQVEKALKKMGITDSKKLSEQRREEYVKQLFECKKSGECEYVTVSVSAKQIDKKGISWCLKSAIKMALKRLEANTKTTHILLDGSLYAPKEFEQQITIIKGDQKEVLIGAASIIAKVKRDTYMKKLSDKKAYESYGFDVHKGYGTKKHREAIQKFGVSSEHRRSFCGNIIS
jgi:ribonuclease HII